MNKKYVLIYFIPITGDVVSNTFSSEDELVNHVKMLKSYGSNVQKILAMYEIDFNSDGISDIHELS